MERGCVEDQPQHAQLFRDDRTSGRVAAGPADTAALRQPLREKCSLKIFSPMKKKKGRWNSVAEIPRCQ